VKIQKQQAMRSVLYALAPLCLAAIYLFGWRFIAVLAVVVATAVTSEYLMAKKYKMRITESLFVSATIFALSLPPTIPLWIAIVGMAFGIVFGKMVFGGFGKNIFNPAITARAFIYISFGVPMTSKFVANHAGFPGGFASWLSVDVISAATPLVARDTGLLNLFLGFNGGSFGETSALLIILGGLYIIYKKSANWKIVVSSLLGFLALQSILFFSGVQVVTERGAELVASPLTALFSGSFLFAAFFMITDPVSAGQSTNLGRWIYGAAFGILTVLIRSFSTWIEGVTFAILLVNMFAPLLDILIKDARAKKKAKQAGGKA
jgi:Na+-transporting NADH:ubiquinone oxidoreductase subunit B